MNHISAAVLGGCLLSGSALVFRHLTGRVYGVSSFMHSPSMNFLYLVIAGAVLQFFIPSLHYSTSPVDTIWIIISGLLIGAGSRLANGCTSGHMICGVGMLSSRSIVATGLFFALSIPTALLFHTDFLGHAEKNLSSSNVMLGRTALAALAFSVIARVPAFVSVAFGAALLLSGMTDPLRVLNFMKFSDSALMYLAIGAIPFSIAGHMLLRAPSSTRDVDYRLIIGSALFGVGWAITGQCPAPVMVNLGRAAVNANHSEILRLCTWLGSVFIGGRAVNLFVNDI